MLWLTIQFIIGIIVLNKSADWFARGAALVAELTGMSRLFMGAILAGFITSLPEFFVSGIASWGGHSEMAIGNAVGSIIFNGLLMGLCLIRSRTPAELTWFRDHGIPMLLACLILYGMAIYGNVSRSAGAFLFFICIAYTVWSIISAKREPVVAREVEAIADETLELRVPRLNRWSVAAVLLVLGILLVYISSHWIIHVAAAMAYGLGISESVISLTIVAAGTSLPEMAAALAATRRGHQDTSLGIIFGSTLFVVGVIGLSGLLRPLVYTVANRLYDLPIMLLITILPFLPCLFGKTPGRVTGYVLLAVFGLYMYSLFTLYGVFM